MEPIRIVFAELPRMLCDILHASLADQPDVLLVGEAVGFESLVGLVQRGNVDTVILGLLEPDLPSMYFKLFDADAGVKILAIADHGRSTSVYDLRPHREALGERSPQELIRVMCSRVRSRGEKDGTRATGQLARVGG